MTSATAGRAGELQNQVAGTLNSEQPNSGVSLTQVAAGAAGLTRRSTPAGGWLLDGLPPRAIAPNMEQFRSVRRHS
jgi:hypothetical protein